jgi:hypothetical protein
MPCLFVYQNNVLVPIDPCAGISLTESSDLWAVASIGSFDLVQFRHLVDSQLAATHGVKFSQDGGTRS